MTGANTPAEIANAIDNLTLGIPGPFNEVRLLLGDGNTFEDVPTYLTSGSRTETTKYTPYFNAKDYCAIMIHGGGSGNSCYFEAALQKEDGTETILIDHGTNSGNGAARYNTPTTKIIFSPLALEDQDSTYRIRYTYRGYYYNGSTQTMYVYAPCAITARTLLQS